MCCVVFSVRWTVNSPVYYLCAVCVVAMTVGVPNTQYLSNMLPCMNSLYTLKCCDGSLVVVNASRTGQ